MRAEMFRRSGLGPARLLAVLAIVLQALLPGSLALAAPEGVDVSHFLCTPSGEISPDARAAAERIARLLGEEPPDDRASGEHCSFCTPVQGAPAPDPIIIAVPKAFPLEQGCVRCEPRLVHKAQGPPLGSRGPPSHL